jgi:hypothetical protein
MQRIMPYATIQPPFTLKLREMPKKELRRLLSLVHGLLRPVPRFVAREEPEAECAAVVRALGHS